MKAALPPVLCSRVGRGHRERTSAYDERSFVWLVVWLVVTRDGSFMERVTLVTQHDLQATAAKLSERIQSLTYIAGCGTD